MAPYYISINVLVCIQGHANTIQPYFPRTHIFGMCVRQRDVDQYPITKFINSCALWKFCIEVYF